MPSLTFVDYTTVVPATWLNEVNGVVWSLFGSATTAGDGRTALGLGTISTQASSNVSITGGSISGITDLAVADGGTGASDAAAARGMLGAAPLDSPAFTGTPTVPVPAITDNSTAVATTAFVRALLIGEIIFVPRATAPDGTVKANGALLTRASYPELWAYAQASGNIAASDAAWSGNPGQFSPGNGSTTFRIPDLRGLIVRGYHDGSGAYETDTGRGLGSYQADDIKSHNHITVESGSWPYGSTTPNEVSGATYTALAQAQAYTSSTGGTEARVRNVALLACIRC